MMGNSIGKYKVESESKKGGYIVGKGIYWIDDPEEFKLVMEKVGVEFRLDDEQKRKLIGTKRLVLPEKRTFTRAPKPSEHDQVLNIEKLMMLKDRGSLEYKQEPDGTWFGYPKGCSDPLHMGRSYRTSKCMGRKGEHTEGSNLIQYWLG